MATKEEINHVATDLHQALTVEVSKLPSFERVMIPTDLVPHLSALMATTAINSIDKFRAHPVATAPVKA